MCDRETWPTVKLLLVLLPVVVAGVACSSDGDSSQGGAFSEGTQVATAPSPSANDASFQAGSVTRVVGDSDGDLILDQDDNCVYVANFDQSDADGDTRGDVCECGDASGDGFVNTVDSRLIELYVAGQLPLPTLCDTTGEGTCDAIDAFQIQLFAVGDPPREASTARSSTHPAHFRMPTAMACPTRMRSPAGRSWSMRRAGTTRASSSRATWRATRAWRTPTATASTTSRSS